MSLTTEKILLESKIADLKRQRTFKEIEADMHIVTIRRESSPLVDVSTIGIDTLEVAVSALKGCIMDIKEIDGEIVRLEKML